MDLMLDYSFKNYGKFWLVIYLVIIIDNNSVCYS